MAAAPHGCYKPWAMRAPSRLVASMLSLLWAVGLARPARADPFYQLIGARSLAMGGAHRGLGNSNDALILNPAGMAITRRYSAEAQFNYNAQDHVSRVLASAVDSQTSPIAAGLAYTREWGNPAGADIGMNRIYFGLAYALVPGLALGITGQNARGNFLEDGSRLKQNNFNGTAGAMLSVGQMLGLGVVYENFAHIKEDQVMPPTLALGVSARFALATLAGDYIFDMRPGERRPRTFGVGGELLLMQALALRGGYRLGHQNSQRTGELKQYVTGGVALVSGRGGAEISTERSLDGSSEWQMVAGVQYGM